MQVWRPGMRHWERVFDVLELRDRREYLCMYVCVCVYVCVCIFDVLDLQDRREYLYVCMCMYVNACMYVLFIRALR
jgi:hypothetical protein